MLNMKNIMIFLLLVYSVAATSADNNGKYDGFKLTLKEGVGEYDIRVLGKKVPLTIGNVFNHVYGVPGELGAKGTTSYIEYENNKYAIVGVYRSKDEILREKINQCNPELIGKKLKPECDEYILGIINTGNNTIRRFNTHKFPMPEITQDKGFLYTGWKESYRAYGCHSANPFKIADLNLDNFPELFFIGGIGKLGNDEEGKTIQTNLFVFSINGGIKKIFNHELSYENFWSFADQKSSYQSSGYGVLDRTGAKDKYKIERGVRRFSKFYFKDFDRNDKLDILVWTREYKSRKKTDQKIGYELEKELFEIYEESVNEFTKSDISVSIAKKYLTENNLSWRLGFPRKNLCHMADEDAALIEEYNDERHNIRDPVF